MSDIREDLGDLRVDFRNSEDDLGLGLTNIFEIKKNIHIFHLSCLGTVRSKDHK